MANVSKKWLLMHVYKMWGFGGQYTKEDFIKTKVPKGGFEITLTSKGMHSVECGERQSPFHVFIPHIGWVHCQPMFTI